MNQNEEKTTKIDSITFDVKTTVVIVGFALSIAGSFWNQNSQTKKQNETILEMKRTQGEQFAEMSGKVNLLIAVNTLEAFRKDPWSGTMMIARQNDWFEWAKSIDPSFDKESFRTVKQIQEDYKKELITDNMINQLNGWVN